MPRSAADTADHRHLTAKGEGQVNTKANRAVHRHLHGRMKNYHGTNTKAIRKKKEADQEWFNQNAHPTLPIRPQFGIPLVLMTTRSTLQDSTVTAYGLGFWSWAPRNGGRCRLNANLSATMATMSHTSPAAMALNAGNEAEASDMLPRVGFLCVQGLALGARGLLLYVSKRMAEAARVHMSRNSK